MEMAWLLVSCLSSIMAWRGARHVHDEAVMGEMRCREDGAGAFEEGGGFRLVLPAIRQDFPIDNRHYHPLNRATEIRVAYWPQSGIIQRIDILQSR